ncbi:MAG: GTP-binding protein [Clostridia bacterium]|nr:GTP-binding protein [Clostridia bacterium]
MEIPVYLFTGFLEAGKTQFIQETLESEEFNSGENTLVIVCEEGICELEPKKFKVENVFIEYIEEQEDINKKAFESLEKKHKAQRVIIEYNGMWLLDNLYAALPKNWSVYQEIFTADAQTFENYNQNMRSLVADKLKSCELVMFNRATPVTDQEAFHKIIRSISKRCSIAYEFTDGHVEEDDIEDPLPFDVNADVIEIKDEDYALWYRDLADDTSKYIGKTLRFKGIVGREKQLGDKAFIFGRHVMTCCAEDIAFQGLICKAKEPVDFKNRDWAIVTAKLIIGEHKVYNGEGPILIAKSIEKSIAPEQEVASFY